MQPLTLITGSSGFLGKNFLHKFKGGENILLLRNESRTDITKQFKSMYGDISSNETLKMISKTKFAKLIHFSWSGIPVLDKSNNKLNLENTLKLIDTLLDKNPDCELNLMGSCLEYGNVQGEVNETSQPISPNDFGETKLKILDYVKHSTKNYRWFRIFYAYGQGQHRNSIINYCYSNLEVNKSLSLNEPNRAHDYIYVGDVASLISKCIPDYRVKGVINIGSGVLTSNFQILKEVKKQMGSGTFENECKNYTGMYASTKKVLEFYQRFRFTAIEKGIEDTLLELKK
jgi:nucleoside-diphosphate-sugar epimerase